MAMDQKKKSSNQSSKTCKHTINSHSRHWIPAWKYGLTSGFIYRCSKCGAPVWILAQKNWPDEDFHYDIEYEINHIEELPDYIAAKCLLDRVL